MASAAVPLKLALPSQVQQAERLVREALADGGRLLSPAGPTNGDSTHFTLTIVADARPDSALCREATFAPILAVVPFDSVEDALDMHGRCSFGLGASVFTRDERRAERLAALLPVGMAAVNDVIAPTAHPATPFGGVGDSGWGATQGAEGLLEMTTAQVVSVRGGRFRPHFGLAAGADPAKQGELMRGLLESAHAPTLGRRLRGWRRLLAALWRGV